MNQPHALFESDICIRVRHDFAAETDAVFAELLAFCRDRQDLADSRIIRCIVHAAQGRLTGISHYIEMARTHASDLILTAEYQTRPGTKRWQGIYDHIHDFNRPFAQ